MDADSSILLATSNPAKAQKLRRVLDGLGYTFRSPRDYRPTDEPEERGGTHREVAVAKAVFWSARIGGLAIASDGGARIPALGGRWNSLFTRRAAGAEVDDHARADHLLGLMRGRQGAERDVIWVEGLALARAGEPLASWEVEHLLGRLVESHTPAQIVGGFWMSGLIYVPRFGKVLAQLSADQLEEADSCWNELRRLVRAHVGGQGVRGL